MSNATITATLTHWRACAAIGNKYEEKYRADGSERTGLQAALGTLADHIIQALDCHYTLHTRFGAVLRANRVEMDIALYPNRAGWTVQESAEFDALLNALRWAESMFSDDACVESAKAHRRRIADRSVLR